MTTPHSLAGDSPNTAVTEEMVRAAAHAAFITWWADRGPGYESVWLAGQEPWIAQARAALEAAFAASPSVLAKGEPVVFVVEEDEATIRLSIGGVEVAAWPDGTPEALALLKWHPAPSDAALAERVRRETIEECASHLDELAIHDDARRRKAEDEDDFVNMITAPNHAEGLRDGAAAIRALSSIPAEPKPDLPEPVDHDIDFSGDEFWIKGRRFVLAERVKALEEALRKIRDMLWTAIGGGAVDPFAQVFPDKKAGRADQYAAAAFRIADGALPASEPVPVPTSEVKE